MVEMIIPVKYFADASVRHLQLSGNLAGSDTLKSELKDLYPEMIWKRTTVGEGSAILIHVLSSNCKC